MGGRRAPAWGPSGAWVLPAPVATPGGVADRVRRRRDRAAGAWDVWLARGRRGGPVMPPEHTPLPWFADVIALRMAEAWEEATPGQLAEDRARRRRERRPRRRLVRAAALLALVGLAAALALASTAPGAWPPLTG